MRKKLIYAIVAVAVLAIGTLWVTGYQVYQHQYTMSGNLSRGISPDSSTLYFKSSSGETLAKFNFTTRYVNANNTMQGVGFGFRLWHAQGINIERVNLTFDIGPSPADVWVRQFSYYTGSNPPLRFANANFSRGSVGVSGAVLTLSGFPTQNPSTLYGVGLAYKNADLPARIGSTSVSIQMVLASGSGIPFVGDTYTGQSGFNLVYVA